MGWDSWGLTIELMRQEVEDVLTIFDTALPSIKTARNVIEHLDDYALDKGNNKKISRKELEVDTWDGSNFGWLDIKLNVRNSQNAAEKLFGTIKKN
ncbi:MAG: hypothetical protein JSR33_05985 [Proteobacteria bacterium]|nr:hypothetical protein [Pseudomonadota bacterium]